DAARTAAAEPENAHVVEVHLRTAGVADANEAGSGRVTGAVDGEIAQDHLDGSGRRSGAVIDVHAVGAGSEDRANGPLTIDGDRLGDRDGPEATGIEAVDFAARHRLRDGARKGLARRREGAGIGVVANTGNPGARLRMSGVRAEHRPANDG